MSIPEICYKDYRLETETVAPALTGFQGIKSCILFFFFWSGLREPISCSLLGGVIKYQNRGYKITRLCPSLCYFDTPFPPSSLPARRHSRGVHYSTPLHSDPLDPLAPLDPIAPFHSTPLGSKSDSDSESVISSATLLFAPSNYMPDCSHHLQEILATGRQVERSQRSIIGCVAIYCASVFCLLVTDFLIHSKPASPIASSNGG